MLFRRILPSLMVLIFAASCTECANPPPVVDQDHDNGHYDSRYSGRSLTARDPSDPSQGHPLYNSYSKWIHQRSHGVYGFSLDDDEGLKACQSPTVNAVACPICIPDASGKKCQLPSKSFPDPVSKVTLISANSEIIDPKKDPATYMPSESYLTPTWLTLNKFDATKGSIDTDFSVFPDNQFYSINQALTREHPFHIAFNIANQSGQENSTCRMKIPMWVTIDAGSPNLILAYQRINPGEGYQFLINMYDSNLRTLLARTPSFPNPYISGPLVGNDGKDRCASECSSTMNQTTVEADCLNLPTQSNNSCVQSDQKDLYPSGYSYCECPTSKTHCDPNFKIMNNLCYDLHYPDNAQPSGFPHPTPCSPCFVQNPPICSDLNKPNTPACCFNQSYSSSNYAGSKSCISGNYYDWQLGGGRIIISYVDPKTQEGIPEEFYRNQPKNCALDPQNCDKNIKADWNAQTPQSGAKIAAAEQDNYAALLEFTVDYFMNVPGPDGYKGPVVFYDISSVDSLNLPVYIKAVGENKNPQEKCVSNGGQCCFAFIGSPQFYVDENGGTLKEDCPTDIFANKKNADTIPWWGNCISPYGYCSNRQIGASGKKSLESQICNVWNNFENESPSFAQYKNPLKMNPPLSDVPTIKRLSDACVQVLLDANFIANKGDVDGFISNTVLWPNEKTCGAKFIVSDVNDADKKICCEPRMVDYVNDVIWGCESASSGALNKEKIKINNQKCRAMNWGVFPNYSQFNGKIIGTTPYERPSELLSPDHFTCDLESCDVSYANKPFDGSLDSMLCKGSTDLSMCCNQKDSAFCWGIRAPK